MNQRRKKNQSSSSQHDRSENPNLLCPNSSFISFWTLNHFQPGFSWPPSRPCTLHLYIHYPYTVCSGSVVVTAYDFESGRPGSNPEWGLIYYKASITAQGLPEPSSLRGSTLGTRAAEHKGCNWGMQIDWWLQPRAVFNHTFSGIIWHMPQK